MSRKRIAIIGAGPIGLEAALYAQQLGGYDLAVYDAGQIAHNVASWGFVRLFSPWRMNTTPLGRRVLRQAQRCNEPPLEQCPTGSEFREQYLLPLASLPQLRDSIRPQTRVISIGRDDFAKADAIGSPQRAHSPFRILLSDANGRERIEHADVVLDCSGTYGNHRWAGRGGVPAAGERRLRHRICYTLPDILDADRGRFADRHTLLLGCGHSAATALSQFDELHRQSPQTQVTWAIRRRGQALQAIHADPLPARRELVMHSLRLADAPPPWLRFLGACVLEQLDSADDGRIVASLRCGQEQLSVQVDQVVALVGYVPDNTIFEQLQVHQCYATGGPIRLSAALLGQDSGDCLTAGSKLNADTLKNPEPNFFILGAKSYGTNSNFLLQVGHRQIVDAFRLLSDDPKLNLYQS
ncbi:FAD-dependent oxidoreductase [Fontivita pretiosa]|jgi:hypothetical protein|uniref:FAD-dependent oxidoreductase n=1 Tax=Fontivita pretiosa TaxID=2989684 RepID=UPI003D186C20